jgi:copper transport protein
LSIKARGCAALTALLMGILVTAGPPVEAHALLLRSDPAPGIAMPADQAPSRVSLWYSEPVDVTFNGVAVLDSANRRVDHLDARVAPDDARRVDVDVGGLPEDGYVVKWQVTSADNHVVRGTFWFAVGVAVAPPAAGLFGTQAPTAPTLEVAARWIGLIAMLMLVGASFFRFLVQCPVEAQLSRALPADDAPSGSRSRHARSRRPAQAVWSAGMGVFVLAQVGWATAQAEAIAGVPVPQAFDLAIVRIVLFGSRFAALWWARLLLGLGLGGILLYHARHESRGRPQESLLRLAALIGAVLIGTTSLSSHASAARAAPVLATIIDAVHLASAAVWLGGLFQLTLWLPSTLSSDNEYRARLLRLLVPRFSSVALLSVALLVTTGVFSAWEQVATIAALVSTAYGQTLILKFTLLIPLLGIAAVNLLVVRPHVTRDVPSEADHLPRRFQKLVAAEATIGIGVLLVVALLASSQPPGQQSLPGSTGATRQAGDLRVELRVDPNWVGISTFHVTLTDAQGRPPTGVRDVVLTFTMAGMNMGRTTVTATSVGDGDYEAVGYYVGMPGISQVGVAIARTTGADQSALFQIEVPDLNQRQFLGLETSLRAGLQGVLGIALAFVAVLALALAWREVPRRLAPLIPAAAGLLMLLGGGLFVSDQSLASSTAPELGSPVPATPARLAQGKELYTQDCAVCHGDTGIGNGPAAASLLPPPADLTLHARWHADEQLFWYITHGVAGTAMPAWGDRLSMEERWAVLAYLHELASAPTASPLPPPPVATPTGQATPFAAAPPTPATAEATSGPASAGQTGRLVFGPDSNKNLWVWHLPAEKPESITSFDQLDFSSNPVWSPDGRYIAFAYYRLQSLNQPIPSGTDLYVINADGSDMRMVAAHDVPGAVLQNPTWSADGSALYVSYQAPRRGGPLTTGIDRVEVTSGIRSQIVAGAAYPTLSRDGQRLAYLRTPTPTQLSPTLWWSAPDGSNAHQILGPNVFVRYANLRLSPDGQRLLFAAVGQGPPSAGVLDTLELLGRFFAPSLAWADGTDPWELWTIDLDGHNPRRLTNLAEDLPAGAWSPDGSRVAFIGGGSATTGQTGLAIIGADGQGLRRLAPQPSHRGVDWAPPPA